MSRFQREISIAVALAVLLGVGGVAVGQLQLGDGRGLEQM